MKLGSVNVKLETSKRETRLRGSGGARLVPPPELPHQSGQCGAFINQNPSPRYGVSGRASRRFGMVPVPLFNQRGQIGGSQLSKR